MLITVGPVVIRLGSVDYVRRLDWSRTTAFYCPMLTDSSPSPARWNWFLLSSTSWSFTLNMANLRSSSRTWLLLSIHSSSPQVRDLTMLHAYPIGQLVSRRGILEAGLWSMAFHYWWIWVCQLACEYSSHRKCKSFFDWTCGGLVQPHWEGSGRRESTMAQMRKG